MRAACRFLLMLPVCLMLLAPPGPVKAAGVEELKRRLGITPGMKHRRIGEPQQEPPPAPPPAPPAENPASPASPPSPSQGAPLGPGMPIFMPKPPDQIPQQNAAASSAPKPAGHFPLPETLELWPHMSDLLSQDTGRKDAALAAIGRNPGTVPPEALMIASQILVKRKRMSEAAHAYFAAQLRRRFDTIRLATPAEREARATRAFNALATRSAGPVRAWLLEDPGRIDQVMDSLSAWDARVPYAYRPLHGDSPSAAPETWPDLHANVRAQLTETVLKTYHALESGIRFTGDGD